MKNLENEFIPKQTKVLSVKDETEDTKLYRLLYPIKHDPGQFVELSLYNIGEAPFGICSYSKRYIEICVRAVGRVTNRLHDDIKKGDKVGIRGPYGHGWPINEMKDKDVLLVAGGTGLVPVRSVIEYIEQHRKNFGDITIFLGFKKPELILFGNDIKRWEKDFDVNLTVDETCRGWKCNVGLVTKYLEKARIPPQNRVVLTCGPPVMMKYVIQTLKNKHYADDQIYLSLERMMKCGFGKCGHCMIKEKYVCKDGPIFRYDEARVLED
ncbi:MAG: FAD/NAD(P)-binding protein [Candidatus Altiarchaeota archaeon]